MHAEMSRSVAPAPVSHTRRTAHPGATVRVQTHHATFFAVFGACPGSMLAETAARVAFETLHQELSLLEGRRPIQSELTEVVSRLDLALRLTHPSGGPLARGCLSIVCLTNDELLLLATRTGSAVIVEDSRDVVLATPNAPGRISAALGGSLSEAEQPIRMGWARLPPLNKQQRLVVATRDLSVLFSPHELVTGVGSGSVESATSRLQAVASQRGEDNIQLTVTDAHEDLTDACLTQVHTMFRSDDVRLRTPPPVAPAPGEFIDPVATHHGQIQVVHGRIDRWLVRRASDPRSRPPGITLLGPAGWHDVKSVRPRVPSRNSHPMASGAINLRSPTTTAASESTWLQGLLLWVGLVAVCLLLALLVV